ncbi:MAG: group II truncated hemoglobin [Gammaproteobacteria bacterium]|nr:group II truncated hemoglobin [Gammaproteobacteria bacterium]
MGFNMYEELGGEEVIRKLSTQLYQVMGEREGAETIRAMHKEDTGEVADKLFMFLSGWLGGPPLFTEKFGSPCLTHQHEPFAIGPAERDAWLECMDQAMSEVGIEERLQEMLRPAFANMAEMLRNTD